MNINDKIKIYIVGGGVAGMTVAHELVKKKIKGEKIFDITILEKDPRYIGGKARSIYHREGEFITENHNFLPGEHGFRFFPGFYSNIIQTFKEIKTDKNTTVYQNLVQTSTYMFAFNKEFNRNPIEIINRTIEWDYFGSMYNIFKSFKGVKLDISPDGKNNFLLSVYKMITSHNQRKTEEYERTSWKEFIDAENASFGPDYSKFFADGLTRSLAAAKSHKTSTRTGSLVFPKMLYEVIAPYGRAGRILNAPTNEAWLNHWEKQLKDEGVEFKKNVLCTKIEGRNISFYNKDFKINSHSGKVITNITVIDNGIETKIENNEPDYNKTIFVFAVPVEKMADILIHSIPKENSGNIDFLKEDITLKYITDMKESVDWMCGIVFYLKNKIEVTEGHLNLVDSAWAITGIHQDQFWSDEYASDKFGGTLTGSNEKMDIKGVLSFIMSNCDKDGNGKDFRTVSEMTRTDVIAEAWEQIKKSPFVKETDSDGNVTYRCLCDDDIYIDYERLEDYIFLDKSLTIDEDKALEKLNKYFSNHTQPTYSSFKEAYLQYISFRRTHTPCEPTENESRDIVEILENDMKLLINSVNTFQCRPASYTKINNLFLAGDYIRTDVDLATMEGANESGKRAANSIVNALINTSFFNEKTDFDSVEFSEVVNYKTPFRRFLKSGLFISILALVLLSILLVINIETTTSFSLKYIIKYNQKMKNFAPHYSIPFSTKAIYTLQYLAKIFITLVLIFMMIKHWLTRPKMSVFVISLIITALLLFCTWRHPLLFSAIMLIIFVMGLISWVTIRIILNLDGKRYREGLEWQANVLLPNKFTLWIKKFALRKKNIT